MQRKKMLIAVLTITLLVGVVSAAVVNYLSNTIVAETTVELPITLDGSQWTFSPNSYGGDNHLMLVGVTNNANSPVEGVTELSVEKWDGDSWEPFDGTGIYVAASSDIEYAFDPTINPSLSWQDWFKANPSWIDWVVSDVDNLNKFDVCKIATRSGEMDGILGNEHNTGDPDGDRDRRPTAAPYGNEYVLTWNTGKLIAPLAQWKTTPGHLQSPPEDEIPAKTTYHTMFWIAADPALEPGTYRFSARIIPLP